MIFQVTSLALLLLSGFCFATSSIDQLSQRKLQGAVKFIVGGHEVRPNLQRLEIKFLSLSFRPMKVNFLISYHFEQRLGIFVAGVL